MIMRRTILSLVIAAGLVGACCTHLNAAYVGVDCSQRQGLVRPLHGVNNGPLNYGETVDLSSFYRQLRIPYARLHDSEWPNPDIVDISAVFPKPDADPGLATSYDFSRTDTYIKAIIDTGCRIVYRLGESIEWTKKKYDVVPPSDYDAWAAACIGVIRHYNEGWAEGHEYDIQYWEIWNEPENRPNMWTGTDDDFYRLYAKTATAIKARYPDLKVGGPSVGAVGELVGDQIKPYPFLKGFLEYCKANSLPLDFFSWHTYSNDPYIYTRKALAIRKLLDDYGFKKTEIHLNEWNYLPDNDWTPLSLKGQGAPRRRWFDRIAGAEGAAFLAATLCHLQDSPVDVANYYSGDTNSFGLFDRYGTPRKTFYAMKAFTMLLETPNRIRTTGAIPGQVSVCAGLSQDKTRLTVLAAVPSLRQDRLNFVVDHFLTDSRMKWQLFQLDAQHDLQPVRSGISTDRQFRLAETIAAPCVLVLRLEKSAD